MSSRQQITQASIEAALERAEELGEIGVQVAAYLGDELIVDAWIGRSGPAADSSPVDGDTVFPIFSVTKALTVTAVHLQAERGLIDYDAPLARYWPEYGSLGKQSVTVRHVLTHRAGVPQMPEGVTTESMTDWDWMIRGLEKVEPVFPPGTKNTYLAMTLGWLLAEIVQRTDPAHRPFGQFVQDEICGPLGIDAFWIGVPPGLTRTVATLSSAGNFSPPPGSLAYRAAPPLVELVPEVFNRVDVQAACIPAVGGIANARSVARLFSLYAQRGEAGGVRLLSEDRVLSMLEPRPEVDLVDETFGMPFPVGVGGLWLGASDVSLRGSYDDRRILAHTGAGGSIGWADVDSGLAVAICHNRMFMVAPEPPFGAFGDAVFELARQTQT
jgi:CubicO group peptidase (beta-lactamase class C family)